jgi:hypothetical protein
MRSAEPIETVDLLRAAAIAMVIAVDVPPFVLWTDGALQI